MHVTSRVSNFKYYITPWQNCKNHSIKRTNFPIVLYLIAYYYTMPYTLPSIIIVDVSHYQRGVGFFCKIFQLGGYNIYLSKALDSTQAVIITINIYNNNFNMSIVETEV